MQFYKPIVVASSCLEHENVRYNGQVIPSKIIKDLEPYVKFIRVCPEYEIGLGVPREPIRIVKVDDNYRLLQHKTNKDVTDDMNNFSIKFIEGLKEVDGFIFKSKSPTMGVKNIKVYSGMKGSPVIEKCGGFFAGKIAEKFKGYPIEEEDRLRNSKIRNHFLTKLFLFANYKKAKEENTLNRFDDSNKLLFKFYNPKIAQELNVNDANYFEKIKQIMLRPPAIKDIIRFFTDLLDNQSDIINRYVNNKISFETLKETSKFLIKDEVLLKQSFYNPYPEELITDSDIEREKDYWK